MLRVAEILLDGKQPGPAARRRAASTAYYSVFQRLSALCAWCLSGSKVSSPEYRRAYRVLDHKQVRDALSRSAEFNVNLGAPFARLQDIRQWADYNVSTHPDETEAQAGKPFTMGDARKCVIKAREAIEFVDSLDPPSRRRLAVLLIVRDRR
jgi:hypothetical protein